MSLMSRIVNAPGAPEAVGAYPHARVVGDWIFLSGVGPRKPLSKEIPGVTLGDGGKILNYDIRVQTESVIENVRTILKAVDSSLTLAHVIDVQVFLTNMKADFKVYNEVYAHHFSSVQATRTTVEVLSLPTPIAVEFKVIAFAKL